MEMDEKSRQAYWFQKDINKAIRDYDMIKDGDKIAVAVSGGKDSLSLLELLLYRQATSNGKYSIKVIYIIGDTNGPGKLPHPDLIKWLNNLDVEVAVEDMIIPEGEKIPMDCDRCSWNKRRTIFETVHRLGCTKVAFGHHADDLAATTLLNLFFGGRVETMAPSAEYFDGAFHLIRPLCYTSEKAIRRFARVCDFPPPTQKCPRARDSRRQMAEELIDQVEKWSKDIRVNLLKAGLKGNLGQDGSNETSG